MKAELKLQVLSTLGIWFFVAFLSKPMIGLMGEIFIYYICPIGLLLTLVNIVFKKRISQHNPLQN